MSNSTCPIRTDRFLRILFALGTSQARHTVRKTSMLGLFLGASHIHYAYVRLHDDTGGRGSPFAVVLREFRR